MIFTNVDTYELNPWTPELREWEKLLSVSRRMFGPNFTLPDEYQKAGIIIGPLSAERVTPVLARGSGGPKKGKPSSNSVRTTGSRC